MTDIFISTIASWLPPPILAQAVENNNRLFNEEILSDLGSSLITLGEAILYLIVGYVIALIAKAIVKGILNRTSLDNKIASWVTGHQEGGEAIPVEDWTANLVFWIIFLFAIIAFLNALELEAVSEPLNRFLGQITEFIPKLIGAAILIAVAWIVATVVKLLVIRGLGALNLDERFNRQIGDENTTTSQFNLTETIGNALYWFVFLVFLPSILSTLDLEGTLTPVQTLLDEILAILPNILAAVLIGAIGWLVAQIIRRLVTNLLSASGIDRVGTRFGLSTTRQTQSLSWIIGTLVYVLILIPVAIAALNALQIEAISVPAINMLNQVLNLLPKLFAAAVVLILAYIAGKYVSELVSSILSGIGFNNVFDWLGITSPARPPSRTTAPPPPEAGEVPPPPPPPSTIGTEQPTVIQTDVEKTRTPSELVGAIVWIAIMLIATLTAVDILEIEALTAVVSVILVIAGQVLIGLIVFAIGLYLANLAFNLITSSGTRQSRILGQTARIAIITLVSAMALQEMGVAANIVNLAFGLILGGIAVAIALAFGLGARDVAGQQAREWLSSFKEK